MELCVGWQYGNIKGWHEQPSKLWNCKASKAAPCCCAQCNSCPTPCPFPSWQYQLAFMFQQGINT